MKENGASKAHLTGEVRMTQRKKRVCSYPLFFVCLFVFEFAEFK